MKRKPRTRRITEILEREGPMTTSDLLARLARGRGKATRSVLSAQLNDLKKYGCVRSSGKRPFTWSFVRHTVPPARRSVESERDLRARLAQALEAAGPEGLTVEQLADAVGLSRSRVSVVARELGFASRKQPRPKGSRGRCRLVYVSSPK